MKTLYRSTLSLSFLAAFNLNAQEVPFQNKGVCKEDKSACVYFSPTDMPVEAVRAYLNSAKKSIRIASYNFSISDYAAVLNAKANNNVKIEFLIDYHNSYSNKTWDDLSPKIERVRIPVLRGGNPQMHNKIIIIDEEVVLTGSANYSPFGLIANFENVIALRDKDVVKKYSAEVTELKALSLKACEIFTDGDCLKGGKNWDSRVHHYLAEGGFLALDLNPQTGCKNLSTSDEGGKGEGLFDSGNQLKPKKLECLKDQELAKKFQALASFTKTSERFVDGGLVSELEGGISKFSSKQTGKIRSFFSPEDNLEMEFQKVLDRALVDPKNSFAYFSTNFITNGGFAKKIKELHDKGVRVRILYDRGRFKDPMFKFQLPTLLGLGFFGSPEIVNQTLQENDLEQEFEPGDFNNKVTVFSNEITTDYGCNHNKFAVIGTPSGLTLINGSANWSGMAMRANDENALVIEDQEIASVYLKEIINQMYTYRYGQNDNLSAFKEEISYLSSYAPCMRALLGYETSCKTKEGTWTPSKISSNIVSLHDVPANPETETVWAWVPQLNDNKGGAVRLYTHEYFGGKWVGTIALAPTWKASFKFFILPANTSPEKGMHLAKWEYGGSGNDRWVDLSNLAFSQIKAQYFWGKP
jgi:phosphatidylserine/phosphatidylglycerophosphate/cardiolipin synthase-like enzyme